MEKEKLIEGKGITVRFTNYTDGKRSIKTVLEDLDIDIYKGEILGLAGESGSGKSTLAKALLGIVPLASGTIETKTKSPQMIFQDPYSSLNPAKKISWIMEEPLKLKTSLSRTERRDRVSSMLKEVGLSDEFMIRSLPNSREGSVREYA